MSDTHVTFTAKAKLPLELLPILTSYLGMPSHNTIPNPDYTDLVDDLPEGEVAMFHDSGIPEEIEQDWSNQEMEDFVNQHVQGLLVDMVKGVVPLGTDAIKHALEDKQAEYVEAIHTRDAYLQNLVTVEHENE